MLSQILKHFPPKVIQAGSKVKFRKQIMRPFRRTIIGLINQCMGIFICMLCSGHATAGGCMIALAHDYRYMRSDRGFIFLNEVRVQFVACNISQDFDLLHMV